MGIERFFSKIKKEWNTFTDLYSPYKNNIKGDKLFIDFNSIIYSIYPKIKNINNKDNFERVLLEKVNEYINELYNIFNKKLKLIYIAIDGVPSNGKILEQRKRAYVAQFIKRLIDEKYKSDKFEWSKSNIKPGTDFMDKLYNSLLKLNFNNCDIVISSHNEPGEGEMKIILYILNNGYMDGIIFSPDSDMIILILLLDNNVKNKFYLFRLDQQLSIKNNDIVYNYSDIWSIKQVILNYIDDKIGYNFNEEMKEQLIKEIMYIYTFFGNDFLPPSETIKISTDIYYLLDCYIYNYIKNGNIMNKNKKWEINITNLLSLLQIMEKHEFMFLKRNYYETKYERFESNLNGLFYMNIVKLYTNIKSMKTKIFKSDIYKKILKNKDNEPNMNFGFFKYKAIKFIKWKNLNYLKMNCKQLLDNIIYMILDVIKKNQSINIIFINPKITKNFYFKPWQDRKYFKSTNNKHTYKLKNKSDKSKLEYIIMNRLDKYYDVFPIQDPFYTKYFYKINETNYIENYNRFISKDILHQYMEGLGWVFNYYLNKSKNNTFAFYGHRTPLLYHLIKNLHEKYFIENNKFLNRSLFEHLVLVTPNPTTIEKYRNMTIKEKENIKKVLDKYPKFFPDMNKVNIKDLHINCLSSIYVNKCHFKFLENKIPFLNI